MNEKKLFVAILNNETKQAILKITERRLRQYRWGTLEKGITKTDKDLWEVIDSDPMLKDIGVDHNKVEKNIMKVYALKA